ncbi:hypothetical protein BJ878DRAFT_431088 [Calycina marina]|uniref:Uncharacterized protein n=1 Tax=Calycina marina TaxID=1763456 RepID=A0A9P7YUS7_9HELO|nr:hypothetical protein BJ878DRAFT_431088 [Calycina marina]
MADDERPISLRKTRRSSAGPSRQIQQTSIVALPRLHGISTPPATPKRNKKRVRFSDPGSAIGSEAAYASSGLTPLIQRTALSTPQSKRRHTTLARLWNLAPNEAPISGTLQFEPLRQILDGRVKRRLRRHRLSEETNIIDEHRRDEANLKRTEVERLKEVLHEKDIEVQSMRDEQDLASQLGEESGRSLATNAALAAKVQDLEKQIASLKAELAQKYADNTEDSDWTMAARDPFNFDEDDDMIVTNYSHDFSMMNNDIMSTPTRLGTYFPSPPTSMPNTPSKAVSVYDAGIQVSLPIPDPEKGLLRSQLEMLEAEISKLNSSLALSSDNTIRLQAKLSGFTPGDEEQNQSSLDLALDTVLTKLALSQVNAMEKENAFDALSFDVTSLGFPSCSGPEQVLEKIAAQFRQARLDLEYMTPGEVVEGFENEKLLEMLVTRMQFLVERVKEADDHIDEYHDQELLLRQQLSSRINVMQELRKELGVAKSSISELETEVEEKDISNVKLQKALERYREEVQGLEFLISTMEKEGHVYQELLHSEVKEVSTRLLDEILKHDTTRAMEECNQTLIMELQRRLSAALQARSDMEARLEAFTSSSNTTVVEKEALKSAHSTILNLRTANATLERQLESENSQGRLVVEAMRGHISQVLETLSYVNGDSGGEGSAQATMSKASKIVDSAPIVKQSRLLDGDLARRSCKKRRYDSGLGFLEEEGVKG